MNSSTAPSESDCRVKVVCRIRPLNQKEKENSSFVVGFPSHCDTTVQLGGRLYCYDKVFRPESTQEDVYHASAKPLVRDVLSGYNATIFAYGQTSSGKTHTMEGDLDKVELQGVIPRIVGDMFEQLYNMDASVELHIKVSYFEIYMEKIRDLLDVSKVNLPIGETKRKVPYVKGVTERFVTVPEEILEAIEEGKANRRVAITNMNAHSSRSHAVFLISVKQVHGENHKTITGKLYLVDLAGSEKVDKTNAQGLTLEEAKTINKSLLSLSNVISALSEGNKPFIPYRDSKLTRVLQESLGGNARTTLVICCSPSSYNVQETKTTLMFGDRAKAIKNKVEINVELTAEEWRRRYDKLKESHGKMRKILEGYESELSLWRNGAEVSIEQQQRPLSFSSDVSMDSLSIRSNTPPTRGCSPALQQEMEERARLSSVIEEKNEMLQSQSELIQRLTQQVRSLEKDHEESMEDNRILREEMAQITVALNNSQAEVREVMQALEELAVSYDVKDREIERSISDKQVLEEEVNKLQQSVDCKSRELNQLQDSSHCERRKHQERLSTLLREMGDVSVIVGSKMDGSLGKIDSSEEISDEDFTKAKIHMSTLRYDVISLAKQREVLEEAEKEARGKIIVAMGELSSCRTKIAQYELQNKTLHESLLELEQKKKELESSMTGLQEQLSQLRTLEEEEEEVEGEEPEREGAAPSDRDPSMVAEAAGQAQMAGLEEEVDRLRREILEKEVEIKNITKQQEGQYTAMAALMKELEETQKNYGEEKEQLLQAKRESMVKQRLQHDLGGLTDTVSREMERLNELRDLYARHVTSRLKSKSVDESLFYGRPKECEFLEKNLEELERGHKKAVSENSEMSREIPRLRSFLVNKSKRIGQLEHMIGETREVANTEYEKLRSELDQTRTSFQAKLREKERESQNRTHYRRASTGITCTDQLTGLSHTHLYHSSKPGGTTVTDPLTGLVQSGSREPPVVDEVTGLMLYEGRAGRRPGPTFVRPVTRRNSTDWSARDRLVAGAGVALIGQRAKPPQLTNTETRAPAPSSRGGSNSSNSSNSSSRSSMQSSSGGGSGGLMSRHS